MISRSLSNTSGAQQYYFQIKLNTLRSNTIQNKKLKISIFKGIQKSDFTKQEIKFVGKNLNLGQIVLNFYISSYNPKKSIEFNVILTEVTEEKDIELGQFSISTNPYIVAFIEDGTFSYQLSNQFSQQFELDYSLYIDRSRLALINAIKKFESQKKSLPEKPVTITPQPIVSTTKPLQKPQDKMQTPKVKRQIFRNSPISKQEDTELTNFQQKNQSTRDLSQNTRRVLRRTGNNSKSHLINDSEQRKRAESVKNQQINFQTKNVKKIITRSPQIQPSLKKSESKPEDVSSPRSQRKNQIIKPQKIETNISNEKDQSSGRKLSRYGTTRTQEIVSKPLQTIEKKVQKNETPSKVQTKKNEKNFPPQKKPSISQKQPIKIEPKAAQPMSFNLKMGIAIGIGLLLIFILSNAFGGDKSTGKKKAKKQKKNK